MKKSLLLLGAACIALSGSAAANKAHQRYVSPKFSFDRNVVMKDGKNSLLDSRMSKVPAKAGFAQDVIYEAEGQMQSMSATCSGFLDYDGYTLEFEDEVFASHVVYGENDDVYIYNILPQIPVDAYVKGKKEGDKIVVDLPQTVIWNDNMKEGANLTLSDYFEFEEDGVEYYSYAPLEDKSLTFSISEDGTWKADDINPKHIIAYSYCTDGVWAGYGAWDLSLEPFNATEVVVPDDIEVSENFWTYKCDYLGYGWNVNFAQGGEEVYFQGLSEVMPEAWVKATVEYDDTEAHVYIDQNQYVGVFDNAYIVTKCAKFLVDEEWGYEYYELLPDDYRFELIWDYEEEKMVLKDPSVALLFNRSMHEVYYADELYEFELLRQEDFEGTPQNPYNLTYYDMMEDFGEAVLECYLPALSTDGGVLDVNDLYYVVYANDEPLTFDVGDYGLEESIEEIPWTFENDDMTIMKPFGTCRHAVYVFVEGISTIGVQSVYRYDGKETRSEIVTLDLEADPDAVGAIEADKKISDVKYYGIDGREVAELADGLFIKRVTFSDG
ncbi:MAG: hypothetical protein K2H72_05460, partial [Muribaculaceae bacterium]|nr:hypothetical protein [Muribaculaceae bacterium]